MKILFLHTNRFIKNELQELISDMKGEAYFAATTEEAVVILNSQPIDIFFLELKGIADAGLLKYTNDHFKNVRIFLTVKNGIKDAIATIKSGHFNVLQQPFALRELREVLMDYNRREAL